jgi:uncharacterized protein YaaR (DUF327 family)
MSIKWLVFHCLKKKLLQNICNFGEKLEIICSVSTLVRFKNLRFIVAVIEKMVLHYQTRVK